MVVTSNLLTSLDRKRSAGFSMSCDEADSIVIDPHKHGLQPYGCGCVLFKDPAVGRFYQARLALHLLHVQASCTWGRFSLECSRAGAASRWPCGPRRGLFPLVKGRRVRQMLGAMSSCGQIAIFQVGRGRTLQDHHGPGARHRCMGAEGHVHHRDLAPFE